MFVRQNGEALAADRFHRARFDEDHHGAGVGAAVQRRQGIPR